MFAYTGIKSQESRNLINELAMEASSHGKHKPSNKPILTDELQNQKMTRICDDDLSEFNNSEYSDSNDSDDDDDEEESDNDDQKKEDNGLASEFKDQVHKYIKCDDIIRSKTKEIKELKDKKRECEEYIMKYLEKRGAEHINMKCGITLKKRKTKTTSGLKVNLIRDAIIEGMKEKKITNDEVKSCETATRILELIDAKRTKKVRQTISRTKAKQQ